MATNYHFHPPATAKLTDDDPMSVGLVRALQDNANHLKLSWLNVRRGEMCFANWNSPDTNSNEYVVMPFCPLVVPDGYNKLRVSVCHELDSAATGTTAWKLYSSSGQYIGPQDGVDVTKLATGYQTATWTSSVKSAKWADTTLVIHRLSITQETWLMLTAQNSDTGTQSKISFLGITAQVI